MPPSDTPVVRIVWGTGVGPTALASYDAALADAGVHNYNLVAVSSIIPAGVSIEAVGTAPDLGPAGQRLVVVEAKASVAGPDRATAGLGWAAGGGPGVLYEAAGEFGEDTASERIEAGLVAARDLRPDWEFVDEAIRTVSTTVDAGEFATAVVLAVFGTGEPIV